MQSRVGTQTLTSKIYNSTRNYPLHFFEYLPQVPTLVDDGFLIYLLYGHKLIRWMEGGLSCVISASLKLIMKIDVKLGSI